MTRTIHTFAIRLVHERRIVLLTLLVVVAYALFFYCVMTRLSASQLGHLAWT